MAIVCGNTDAHLRQKAQGVQAFWPKPLDLRRLDDLPAGLLARPA